MSTVCMPEDCSKQWEIILLLLSSEEKKIDRTCENEIDTMNYFCRNEGVRKILGQWLTQMNGTFAQKVTESDTARKSDEVSLLWRQRGNDKFRNNAIEESYIFYTKSVSYADQSGPMFPLALANRSAALLKMKKYKSCLMDVALAIDSGYPLDLLHKLLLRRADCHIELKQREEAAAAIAAAVQHSKQLNLAPVHVAEFEKHVKILDKKLDAMKDEAEPNTDAEEPKEEPNVVIPDCANGMNPDFKSASNKVNLRRSDTAGRFVVTKEEIKRGEVIFSEEPYAWVTLPSSDIVCEMCCKTDINPVPCSVCSRSAYCGLACRELAIPAFHRWECVAAQCEIFRIVGIAHLALRVLLVAASSGFPRLPPHLPRPTTAADLFRGYAAVDNIHIYKTDTHPFYRMFNLVTNFDKMPNVDYVQYALTATMLMIYLEQYTTFLEYLPTTLPYKLPADQLKLFTAALILRGLGQLVSNGHATLSLSTLPDMDGARGRTVVEREIRTATAIYPSSAMMNHSCDPNIVNTFYRKRLIIRCARELPAGSEVLNCYGPHRARDTTSNRRAQLRAQYHFSCVCSACSDWDHRDPVLTFSAYACQACKGPVAWRGTRAQCVQCAADFQLERALAVLERADELAMQAEKSINLEERCEKMHGAFRMKQLVLHRHHTSLRSTADRLARLYADAGEFAKSLEIIKQNIQSLEYQFGSFSVEVAHELRKLSDVMLERIMITPGVPEYRDWCLEAQKILKKAVQLMELNYGAWEPVVRRLRDHERLVSSLLADCHAVDVQSVHHTMHYNLKI